MTLITYKCPNCGGRVEFDSSSQMMHCPYCSSNYEVASLSGLDDVLQAPASSAAGAPPPSPAERLDWQLPSQTWAEEEQANMQVYTCKSCAGAIISDATLAATSCPYCGNPVVISERFRGYLKPDAIIPFQLDKNFAKAALLKHYEGAPLLPKRFKDENFINEIKGVYVPFWLFDTICDADAAYRCTTVRHYSDSDYDYTETSEYAVERSGSMVFQRMPVDGSKALADELMESIEPFNFSQLVAFQSAYLSGYFANRYDVDAKAAIPRAEQRMGSTAASVLETSVQGYSTVRTERFNAYFRNPRCTYALLPVWLLSTTFDGKTYTFAMNGQTGRLVGDLPIDNRRYWGYFAKVGLGVMAVIFVIAMIFKLIGGW